MRRFYNPILLIFATVLFSQCQKEVSYIGKSDPEIIAPEPLTANLQGNILDDNNQPAAGVEIRIGGKTATTNANGYFRITEAPMDKKVSLVTAEKSGYYKAYRTFSATSGTNQIVIKLVKKILAGTINASSGGEVTLSNGSKISLPSNAVVQASGGNDYSGTINIYAAYIDPTASDIGETVPGSFMANDINNNRVTLSSYGMIAVELESTAGEKLQIKSGSSATLTTPIPTSVQSSAPQTIALWYVDEQTGLWKEEGTAAKNGSNYIGQVKHFSFWNCDIGIPAVTVKLTLKNTDGLPLVHAQVKITRSGSNPTSAYGWTDSLGQVSGLVPSNEALVLAVLDPCHNTIFSQNIGPFSQNTDLGIITVTIPGPSLVTIKGTLLNCSGAAVTNGFAIIYFNDMVHYAAADANGNFATNFTQCSNSATTADILGIDEGTQQQGTTSTITLTTPITNTGNITACGNSSAQYINYTLDGVNYSISSSTPSDSLMAISSNQGSTTGNVTYILGSRSPDHINFAVNNVTSAGTYPITTLSVQAYNNLTLIQPFNVIFTSFPQNPGEYYEGTLAGQFKDSQNVTHQVNASFRIRK